MTWNGRGVCLQSLGVSISAVNDANLSEWRRVGCHPSIVTALGITSDNNNESHAYLVMEDAKQGTLRELLHDCSIDLPKAAKFGILLQVRCFASSSRLGCITISPSPYHHNPYHHYHHITISLYHHIPITITIIISPYPHHHHQNHITIIHITITITISPIPYHQNHITIIHITITISP